VGFCVAGLSKMGNGLIGGIVLWVSLSGLWGACDESWGHGALFLVVSLELKRVAWSSHQLLL
jgi:hypothetical protein